MEEELGKRVPAGWRDKGYSGIPGLWAEDGPGRVWTTRGGKGTGPVRKDNGSVGLGLHELQRHEATVASVGWLGPQFHSQGMPKLGSGFHHRHRPQGQGSNMGDQLPFLPVRAGRQPGAG